MQKTWSTPVVSEEKQPVPCMLCGSMLFKPSLLCEGFSYVQCTGCGLVQMNPQPLEEEIIRRYSESSGKDYFSYQLQNEKAFLALQLLALADVDFDGLEKGVLENNGQSNKEEPARVLDLGCATGSLLAELKKRGWETVGIEIGDLQADYGKYKKNLDIRSLPLEENNFPASYFNVVLASHLIEHLNNPFSFLREVCRILKDGGHLFITTPNISGFQARLYRGKWRSAIFDHLYLFSKFTLKNLLKKTGFKAERTRTWGGLAQGFSIPVIKKYADKTAKFLNIGDVMIVRAVKVSGVL